MKFSYIPRCTIHSIFALAVLVAAGAGTSLRAAEARWGDVGHRLVAQVAVEKLPEEMPAFFRKAGAQLTYLNPEPDRWRDNAERRNDAAMDGAYTYDHYIDIELIPAARRAAVLSAPNRLAYADSLRAFAQSPATVGLLPFRIVELTQLLRSDFRRWRTAPDSQARAWIEQRIINDAGVLGHYVADASNPAHTSIHHNGWVGENPRGFATDTRFHSRFESGFVGARLTADDVRTRSTAPARSIPALRTSVLRYLDESNGQLERLYTLDKQIAFDDKNDQADHKAFAADRLAAGAVMLRDLWWTAWATSAGTESGSRE